MNEEGKKRYAEEMNAYLHGQVSRAAMLRNTAIGTLAAMGALSVPGLASADTTGTTGGSTAAATGATGRQSYLNLPVSPSPSQTLSGRYTPENLNDILNIAQTAEYLVVTFLTAALGNAQALGLTANPLLLSLVQGILAAEITHVQFLSAAGAQPLTTKFTVPNPKMLTDFGTFFATVEAADTIFVGAYMAAVREFAELGQPYLAKVASQFLGVEAEHRVLARGALALGGDTSRVPPNNKGFETDLFLYVREAAGLLTSLGFLGGTGTAATFPGLDVATAAVGPLFGRVIQKAPNNASEATTTPANVTAEH